MKGLVADIPVMGAEESGALAARIAAMRAQWLPRGEGFYTIGVASYLDVMNSDDPEIAYYGRLTASNALIDEHFTDLLETVRRTLAGFLGAPTRFEDAVARPGFHIFEEVGICTSEQPSQHFDLQHRFMRWPFAFASEDVISFTLPLQLPALGGGLDVWAIQEDDLQRLARMGRDPCMAKLGRLKPFSRHRYSPGLMAVQLKPIMHRISPIATFAPGDRRITLQGHGVRDADGWVLYW